MNRIFFYLLAVAILTAGCAKQDNAFFQMRGVVLSVEDLETVDWPKLAHENGINTIGTHIGPEQVSKFITSEKGKKFLSDCKKYNIHVEHQLHAMSELLPRKLFDEDTTMFRMDENGKRVSHANMCVHSPKALDIVAENARRYAEILTPTNHRYYFWIDDGQPMCKCPECAEYSDSEQALIIENRIIKELRKFDPKAMLAHLSYINTLSAPRKVKPEEGIFLEFAPSSRYANRQVAPLPLRVIKDNLTVFPPETAVILDYCLDVSLFSNYSKPAAKLAWKKDAFEKDIDLYAKLGVKHVTTFAVWIDDKYIEEYKDLSFLKEYGDLLNNYKPDGNQDAAAVPEIVTININDSKTDLLGDGKPVLEKFIVIDNFTNPWNPAAASKTQLSILQNGGNVYFLFKADDPDLVVVDPKDFKGEGDVGKEDRVELFFSKDKDMNEYYGLEIDPLGRILSYRCSYYRNFDFDWNPPASIRTIPVCNEDNYEVTIVIPAEFLHEFRAEDNSIYFGAYRGEFSHREDRSVAENWQTWIDPLTERPDFHVPHSLGKLKGLSLK